MAYDGENARKTQAEALVASRPVWYHRFEIYPGVWTPGVYDPREALDNLALPDDMTGMKVLEIGPADGFFSMALAGRGAEVTTVDYGTEQQNFAVMRELSGHQFNQITANLYDLPSLGFGQFDVVLLMGVLYHLPDMIRGLHTLRPFVGGRLIVETLISTAGGDAPIAEYMPADTNNGDYTNFWAPNSACCQSMLVDCGFIVDRVSVGGTRGLYDCRPNAARGATKKTDVAYSFLQA